MRALGIVLYVLAVVFPVLGLSQLPKRVQADGWEGAMGLIAGQLLIFVVLICLGALCRRKKPAAAHPTPRDPAPRP